MFCHNCGIPRLPGAKFCPECGCKLPDPSEILSMNARESAASANVLPAADPTPVPAPQLYVTELPPTLPTRARAAQPPLPPSPSEPYPGIPTGCDAAPIPRKGRHRVPLLIMAAMVLIGLILFIATSGKTAGSAPAAAQTGSETPWFRNEEGTLYFDASLYTGPSELTIPDTVGGAAVTCIAEDCFAGNTTLTSVILPDTLREIGSGAFSGCSALRGIFIPDGVKLIGSGAFRDCTALEAVCVPASVEAIGYNAFRGCTRLVYILYDGKFAQWAELYSGTITSGTKVYCTDGTYIHGIIVP